MLTVVFENNRVIWVLPTASKISPVHIIRLVRTTLINEQHPCKRVRADEDISLTKSTDVTNLTIDEFKISMYTTGGDASWLNRKNEIHNRSIHNMVIGVIIDSNKYGKNCIVQHIHQQRSIDAKIKKCA